MKRLRLIIFLLVSFQSATTLAAANQNIWVLVIGISEYQYLSDLKYADDDALAFFLYTKRSLGDRINPDQMKLLLNSEATFSEIQLSFEWLIRNVKSEDRVYLYFSGHGGHEDMTISKLGYLHAYDSHDATYNNGGNIDLNFLDQILRTFSQLGAQTFLFLDACHSGKIVDDDYLFLNNSLATKIPNIVKVLSAQGQEESFEHSKWGGGHGVFTYYLLEAVLGYADNSPKNNVVSLYELEKYLIEKVPEQTKYQQIPIVIASNKRRNLFPVIDKTLQLNEPPEIISNLTKTEEKVDPTDEISSESREISQFRHFLTSYDLIKDDVDDLFIEYNRRNDALLDTEKKNQLLDQLISEVINSSQFYINIFLGAYEGDPVRLTYSDAKYKISDALTRTLTLLDEGHPGYNLLATRRIFFESEKVHDQFHFTQIPKKEIKKIVSQAIDNLKYAIEKDPNASYLKYEVGVLSGHVEDFETAKMYLKQSRDFSKNWSFPEGSLGKLYSNSDSALYYYRNALRKKPKVPALYHNLADHYLEMAEKGNDYVEIRIDYDSAILYLNKAIEITDSTFRADKYESLAIVYEDQYLKFEDNLYLTKAIANYRLAILFGAENIPELSAALGNNYSIIDPNSIESTFYEGVFNSYENLALALPKFRYAFEAGYNDWEVISALPGFIQEDKDFADLLNEFKVDRKP